MNKTKQHPNSGLGSSAIQDNHWNSKLEFLADTLLHHIKLEEEQKKPESKGVYIDFKQLK
jgi:hypothetical protein